METLKRYIKGVYGIKNRYSDEWTYVGQSVDVINRILCHIFNWIHNVSDYEFWLIYDCENVDKKSMLFYETKMINELEPIRNILQQEYALDYDHDDLIPVWKNISNDVLVEHYTKKINKLSKEKSRLLIKIEMLRDEINKLQLNGAYKRNKKKQKRSLDDDHTIKKLTTEISKLNEQLNELRGVTPSDTDLINSLHNQIKILQEQHYNDQLLILKLKKKNNIN